MAAGTSGEAAAVGEVILLASSAELLRGCFVCGAYHWDCTVDGCKPRGQNREGDVIHCKICNTVYIVQKDSETQEARRV